MDIEIHKTIPELTDRWNRRDNTFSPEARNLPHVWTSEDTRNALLFSLVPAGTLLVGGCVMAKDRDYISFLKAARTPEWVPRDRAFYCAMDVLTLSPVGYASYLVFKNGGGFNYRDTTIAMALYGSMLVLDLTTVPVIRTKSYKSMAVHSGVQSLVTLATAYAFFNIDSVAGYCMLPISLWSVYKSIIGYSLHQLNSPKEP
ncbi:TspO/MBR family protein [Aphelenchoides avenae]|nr:TspO/MBR family protein [Aphelenchus avenae]